jgi:16S rRNA (guanine966-N2)-methyltransferase
MKLRIISGQYNGRLIDSPLGHKTHPMSEKIRGAIFNMLGDVTGLQLLDAYAGSGAIALEAVSRGASFVTAIDIDKNAYNTIAHNSTSLNIDSNHLKATRVNISTWLDNNSDSVYDIVIADPPYKDVKSSILIKLSKAVKDNGLIIYSLPPDYTVDLPVNKFTIVSTKLYGDAQIVVFKKTRNKHWHLRAK